MKLAHLLFTLAKTTHNAEVFSSGDSKRIGRRVRNMIRAKVLAKAGFFRALWK